MPRFAPSISLQTHDVTNQPDELVNVNLYLTDKALREAVLREAGPWLDQRMTALGEIVGSEEVLEWGVEANRFPPELVSFDRYGRRLDEARFHPAYHRLMALAMDHNIHDLAWTARERGRHLGHMALLALFSEAEAGTMCPINMTYASVAALRSWPETAKPWLDKLIGGKYDPALKPLGEKKGVTLGMAMTEKQGGSDVRANATRAIAVEAGSGIYRLVGHKYFCSAPMSDGFLTLAQAPGGLSCFLVPRIAPDGLRNGIHVMRLKDKLGNRSNASSEIEYHDALAFRLGEEGRGVSTIIDMVHHTRLGTVGSTLGLMRMALAQAINHVQGRRAFQRRLIDQPLMRAVIADLALDYEAAVVLAARVARSFDGDDESERAFARLSVAVGKYWLTKRNPNFIVECMECHGGVGYVEETPMPRLFRESPVNAIWEGSGNVIALDILRTLQREPLALEALKSELAKVAGGDARLDGAIKILLDQMRQSTLPEMRGRWLAERLALVLQGALLVRHAPSAVSEAFCGSRLKQEWTGTYGILPDGANIDAIIARQI
jgi:putative acyl-CoA dehydrogenase